MCGARGNTPRASNRSGERAGPEARRGLRPRRPPRVAAGLIRGWPRHRIASRGNAGSPSDGLTRPSAAQHSRVEEIAHGRTQGFASSINHAGHDGGDHDVRIRVRRRHPLRSYRDQEAAVKPNQKAPMRSDVRLLYAARAVRGFGDGFAIIILPAYLTAIGFDSARIGYVAAASLLGTALLTLAVGFIAPRHDLRNLLLGGAVLMACTGAAFPLSEHIAIIALVAFIGTINPSTGDLGVLVPLEHAMLAHGVPDEARTHAFARYSLIGTLAMAAGALAAALPDFVTRAGIGELGAFRLMFGLYAALGLVSAALYR